MIKIIIYFLKGSTAYFLLLQTVIKNKLLHYEFTNFKPQYAPRNHLKLLI